MIIPNKRQIRGINWGRILVNERRQKVPIITAIFANGSTEPTITSNEISFIRYMVDPVMMPTTAALIPSSDL